MSKNYYSLGLMSGTSGDGIDASIISSDGVDQYSEITNKYFKYDQKIYENLHKLRDKIFKFDDLKKNEEEINFLEREVTLFHAMVVKEISKTIDRKVDFIGFHGQTIYHNSSEKISKQIGDGKLLSQLTKKNVVYNFRQNDLENGGQGAPLTPIFHNTLANKINKKFNLGFPINILNIGGIANITSTIDWENSESIDKICAYDIGPGNCLIDEWVRKNSKKGYDKEGLLARNGNTDKLILNQALENFTENSYYEKSLDVRDFDIFFAKGLSLENGAATITDFTAKIIADGMNFIHGMRQPLIHKWLVCGGGRKNKYLLEQIKNNCKQIDINPIDQYEVDGDFIESQAFAFLAIRSLQGMPISFPYTTRCREPITGGIIVENF